MDIDTLRARIDEVDAKLLGLFERRMEIAREIARYKEDNGLPVTDAGRERALLDERASRVKDERLEGAARSFFRFLMDMSKEEQRRVRGAAGGPAAPAARTAGAAYQGVPGAYAEEALIAFFGQGSPRKPVQRFEDVFAAVAGGEAAHGVVPNENTTTGAVIEVHELLERYPCHIVGEAVIRIDHCLLGVPGANVADVLKVYSHPQGLSQCARFLDAHPDWERIPYYNTAVSARFVAEKGDRALAAVASRHAAAIYGLDVLSDNIQDAPDNHTRFIVIAGEPDAAGSDKVSILIRLDNTSGTLYNALGPLAEAGINMLRIEARPARDTNWEYLFFIDFRGEEDDPRIAPVLVELEKRSRSVRVLGRYKSAEGAK